MRIRQFFDGFRKGSENFSFNIIIIVNTILLSLVYFVGVGLTSITAKVMRKHFLETEISAANTYWVVLDLKKKNTEEYYRQF